VPRLAALALERDDILESFVDKSDVFARTFLEDGTFGFIPGHPSAYTQPLYGFFLTPVYWLFGREWWSVGTAQVLVAVATALLVLEIGRRFLSPTAGLIAAVVTTLHPYLVWHDVHLNREILDHLAAGVVVLLLLLALERLDPVRAGALGVALGIAILGNARLALLPLVAIALLAWRHRELGRILVCGAVLVAACAVTVAPWVGRNAATIGCATITTDSRALWKANNLETYDVLARGDWIDQVPNLPGAPPSPQDAWEIYRETGRVIEVDECAQMDTYQELVLDFWREHPGEKARLAVQSVGFLWQPWVMRTEGRSDKGGIVDRLRDWVEPVYMVPLYLLALLGLRAVPRTFAVVAVTLLGYQTLMAMVFVGTTRYRVPWDFVLALLAGAALTRLWERRT
jgi:4-amino-4-deoxy-L-arabinose transferase-like glycosyltransferase